MNGDFKKATADLLQNTGDAMADALEQMNRGSWVDDHGHDVRLNVAMQGMADALKEMVRFRAEWLGMENTLDSAQIADA